MENNDKNPTSLKLRGTRKIITIVVVLVVIGVLFFAFKNISFAPVKNNLPVQTNQIEPNLPEQTLPLSNDPKDVAWALFQKYLAYNKDHNLDGVKSVVYKVNPVCAAAVASDECKNRMDSAYSYGSAFRKADFTNVWSDGKQTILATDFKIGEDSQFISRTRSIIFFIGDKSNLKLLSFSPDKGAVLEKASSTRAELINKLTVLTEDKDQDGVADYNEQCLSVPAGQTCVKTDPTLRDTNGNGWWDGVEALMK
jgi:hypothetical protein